MWSSTRRQLARHALDLVLGEAQPREARDVQDLIAVDHVRDVSGRTVAGQKEKAPRYGGAPKRLVSSPLLLRRA